MGGVSLDEMRDKMQDAMDKRRKANPNPSNPDVLVCHPETKSCDYHHTAQAGGTGTFNESPGDPGIVLQSNSMSLSSPLSPSNPPSSEMLMLGLLAAGAGYYLYTRYGGSQQ